MSRSGYSDDCESWELICWRGAVAKVIRSKRGQAFLLEMWKAMQSLSEKKLIAGELEKDGAVCAIGAVGKSRGIDMSGIDPEDYEAIASAFGIQPKLAQEIMFMNDEARWNIDPDTRFAHMKKWVEDNLGPVFDDAD